jgi:hypothetical protein
MANHCVACGKPIEMVSRPYTYKNKEGEIKEARGIFQNHKCSEKTDAIKEGIHRGSGDSRYTPSYYTRLHNGFAILNGDESQS